MVAIQCTDEHAPLGCGACRACSLVVRRAAGDSELPLHPDVVLIGRGLYPAAAIGRSSDEVKEISVQQIRHLVLARAGFTPHEGRARIFIVRNAEQLSISAANGLLKTLEEPRRHTYFVLLTGRGDRLLDTVRSRSVPVRFGPRPDEVVRELLVRQGVSQERIEQAVALAAGSASAALKAADAEQAAERAAFVAAALAALEAPDLGPAVVLSESCDPDRRKLAGDLQALQAQLALRARRALGGEGSPSGRPDPVQAELTARRYELVNEAIEGLLERNASPNLTVSTLILSLRRGLSALDPRHTHRFQV